MYIKTEQEVLQEEELTYSEFKFLMGLSTSDPNKKIRKKARELCESFLWIQGLLYPARVNMFESEDDQ
jgi:hypothetical protein